MTCRVIRCQEPGAHVLDVGRSSGPSLQTAVCDAHKARMDAGEAWHWDGADATVSFGADLDRTGVWVFEDWEYIESTSFDSAFQHAFTTLRVNARRPGSGEEGSFDFRIGHDEARSLSAALAQITSSHTAPPEGDA